jgi:phage repressor protein C with HTH and peptisase S24 domain
MTTEGKATGDVLQNPASESNERRLQFEEAFDRIKKATGARTQVQLAEILGIRQSSISDAKRRSSVPAEWFLKLYRKFGLNPDWLEFGSDPVYLKSIEGQIPAKSLENLGSYGQPRPLSRGRLVPVSTMAGAENEHGGWVAQPVEELNIPESFYSDALTVVKVEDAGMEPVIRRGGFVGVDRSHKRLIPGEIYAVQIPHQGLMLKRVFSDPENNRFILRSENPNHPEQYIPIEQQEGRTIGRVVWVLQQV